MSKNIINEWLTTNQVPLQELAVKYNVPLEEVMEIAELYLLINYTIDVLHLYKQLECYDNKELKEKIRNLVCDTL